MQISIDPSFDKDGDISDFKDVVFESCLIWMQKNISAFNIFYTDETSEIESSISLLGDMALFVELVLRGGRKDDLAWIEEIYKKVKEFGCDARFADVIFYYPAEIEHIASTLYSLDRMGENLRLHLHTLDMCLEYGHIQTVERFKHSWVLFRAITRYFGLKDGLPWLVKEDFTGLLADPERVVFMHMHDYWHIYRVYIAMDIVKCVDMGLYDEIRRGIDIFTKKMIIQALRNKDIASIAFALAACYRAYMLDPRLERAAWRQIRRLWKQLPHKEVTSITEQAFQNQVMQRLALMHAAALARCRDQQP